MAIRNNGFSVDSDETHSDRAERLELLSANIDDYAAELGVAGDKLDWAQGARDAWEDARALAGVEVHNSKNANKKGGAQPP